MAPIDQSSNHTSLLPFSDCGRTGINSAIFSSISTVSLEDSDIFRFVPEFSHTTRTTENIFINLFSTEHTKLNICKCFLHVVNPQVAFAAEKIMPVCPHNVTLAPTLRSNGCNFVFEMKIFNLNFSLIAFLSGIVIVLHYKLPVRLFTSPLVEIRMQVRLCVGVNERSNAIQVYAKLWIGLQ